MRLAKVPREEAEEWRLRISALDALRRDARICEEGGWVLIPLRDDRVERIERLGLPIIEGDARPRAAYVAPYDQVAAKLDLPPYLRGYLPKHWELLGDVLVLRIPNELAGIRGKVAEAYAIVLGARTVCQEVGVIGGVHREPKMEVIWGDGTETVHRENGILYKLDVVKVMFSSGNVPEKKRMSELDCRGEVVVDMFAGIGYFTLPLAVHAQARRVVACEINPVAFEYLVENVRLNRVEHQVKPVLGDNRSLPGRGCADRVVMGYVGTTHLFLTKALDLVKVGGVIHYHETCPVGEWPERPIARIGAAAHGRDWKIRYKGEVKSFAPSISHYVLDVQVLS